MAWILLEGLDRSGKSSVAEMYKKQGFDIVHMNAPSKKYFMPGYSGPSYLEEIVDMYNIYGGKDVVFDRTIYGETVWPEIYNRQPMLGVEDFEYLQQIEYNNDAVRYLLFDKDIEAHWQRCVANKEPLNRLQFVQAGRLYDELAIKHNFEKRQLGDFNVDDIEESGELESEATPDKDASSAGTVRQSPGKRGDTGLSSVPSETTLEEKLERANAIRSLLRSPLVKKKGQIFEKLDKDIKTYLEQELETIFAGPKQENFTQDEVQILKVYAQRIKEKLG
jgi:hypothetical protein